MAFSLVSKQGVDTPTVEYPYGKPRNNNGSRNGFPVDEYTHGDYVQFFARLLALGNVVPNNMADNAANGFQYAQALQNFIQQFTSPKANSESPGLMGTPTAPTAAPGTNTMQIATTAFVNAAINSLVGAAPEVLNTIIELATALGNDPNFATTVMNAVSNATSKANAAQAAADFAGNRPLCVCHARYSNELGLYFQSGPLAVTANNGSGHFGSPVVVTHNLNIRNYTVAISALGGLATIVNSASENSFSFNYGPGSAPAITDFCFQIIV
jgi:hypothetical protein